MEEWRRAARGALVGTGIGLALALFLTSRAEESEGAWPFLVFAAIGGALGFLLVALVEGRRPYQVRRWVPLAADEVRQHATRWYAAGGWTMTGGQADALAFARRTAPDPLLALLLFLFGIVPGLLYHLFAGRAQTTTLLTTPDRGGTDLEIIVSSKDEGGRPTANRFYNSLVHLAGPAAPPRSGPAPSQPAIGG